MRWERIAGDESRGDQERTPRFKQVSHRGRVSIPSNVASGYDASGGYAFSQVLHPKPESQSSRGRGMVSGLLRTRLQHFNASEGFQPSGTFLLDFCIPFVSIGFRRRYFV